MTSAAIEAPGGGTSPAAVIEVRGLRTQFGAQVIHDDLDFRVVPGEIMGVVGGSGTGKSVLIKNLIGIMSPDSGSIMIDGEESAGVTGKRRDRINAKFGMLFQGAALFDSLRVWENVAFGLTQGHGMARVQAREIAIEKMAAVGLGPEVCELLPGELSGGMQKRVGLARAIATEPEIIFFDEPTTGLDPIMGDMINELISKCVRETGATALSITHDMSSVRKIADKVAFLYGGKIEWFGPASQVYDSGNPYVDQFVNGKAEGPIELELRAL